MQILHLARCVDRGSLGVFLPYNADVTTDFMYDESDLSVPCRDAFGGDLAQARRDAQLGAERRFRLRVFADFVPQPAFYRSATKCTRT